MWSRIVRWALAAVMAASMTACKQSSQPQKVPAGQEAVQGGAAASQPTVETSLPASKPASKPASRPASTFDSKPPYPVSLYVAKPEEKQPGWLKIEKMADDKGVATCTGSFPERNEIQVQTSNVSRLRLHIGYLPLAQRKRIILHIDKQSMELAHKNRTYIFFERSHTGQWRIVESED